MKIEVTTVEFKQPQRKKDTTVREIISTADTQITAKELLCL